GTHGSSTALQITVAATYGQDLHALADRIREVVGAHVRELAGLEPVEITVVVDEILPPPAA
uniref:Asp23/Gls24 family envelope stress response protein n=1 Tax=Pseudonocardia pini TaxID=2758030 RepID=UPI0015F06558